MTYYDRKYDMGDSFNTLLGPEAWRNLMLLVTMREPGVEPGYLAVPDPKSERADSDPEEKPLASAVASLSATERHASPSNAAQSTTNSTTQAGSALSSHRAGT